MKENKVWGETYNVWTGNNTEVHKLSAIKGGYCSKHKHEHKYNLFCVESGELLIEIWKDNNIIDKTILRDGESTIVNPGQYHRFTVLKDTQALEIYWIELNKDDIIREDQGGINTNNSKGVM